MKNTWLGLALVLALLTGPPALAKEKVHPVAPSGAQPPMPIAPAQPYPGQGGGALGKWGCQFSYAELNPQGGIVSGFNRQFLIAFYSNGGYEAQGQEAGASGYSQFYSQGQWKQMEGALVIAQGNMQSDSPYAIPGTMFGFSGQLQADGSLSFTYEQPDPNRQYVMNRTVSQCQQQQ